MPPALDVVVARATRPAAVGPCRFHFPDPREADAEGLLATGGDLEPATLLAAYRQGVFPWPADGVDLLWWSPDPRAVLPPDGVHVSRSLARALRRRRFRVTIDAAFEDVIAGCAERRGADDETWITPALRQAYVRLHQLGWAHSVEVWADGALAGGVQLIDVQMPTSHLTSMGALKLAREQYLDALVLAVARPVNFTGGGP